MSEPKLIDSSLIPFMSSIKKNLNLSVAVFTWISLLIATFTIIATLTGTYLNKNCKIPAFWTKAILFKYIGIIVYFCLAKSYDGELTKCGHFFLATTFVDVVVIFSIAAFYLRTVFDEVILENSFTVWVKRWFYILISVCFASVYFCSVIYKQEEIKSITVLFKFVGLLMATFTIFGCFTNVCNKALKENEINYQ